MLPEFERHPTRNCSFLYPIVQEMLNPTVQEMLIVIQKIPASAGTTPQIPSLCRSCGENPA
jgi:hypothetical protein